MKVVLFCGGFGTRFKEETEFKPKPMIEIGEKPILWHIMKYYASFGFCEFILCAGYKSEVVKNYFLNYSIYNQDFTVKLGKDGHLQFHNPIEEDWLVTVVDTGVNTLKGGRLKKIEKYINGDTFMLTYGDGLADVDLFELLEFHKRHGKTATLTGVHPPSLFGNLIVDEDGQALMFAEKNQTTGDIINGGFFVLNKEIFEYLEDSETCDFEIGALEKIAQSGNLMVYRHSQNWACMDTLRDNIYLNKLWKDDKAFWKRW